MATALRRALTLLRVPTNEVAFAARTTLRWSRGSKRLPDEPKEDLFAWLQPRPRALARARERALRATYDLARLRACSTRLAWCENLALLDAAERLFGDHRPAAGGPRLRAVDVGAGDFRYATALHRFLSVRTAAADDWTSPPIELCGIEIDGHGVYRDGHARADHGRAHAALAGPDVTYRVADFLRCELPAQDVVTMVFPFLTRYALLQWGLPLRLHRPAGLVARAASLLRSGGLLASMHQTDGERDQMAELGAAAGLRLLRSAPLHTDLVPYHERTRDRWGLLFERP